MTKVSAMKRSPGRRRGSAGYSLVEVLISTMLVACASVALMAVALTGGGARYRVDHRMAAAAAVRQVSEALKQYVTADTSAAKGPGAGPDGWTLPGDLSGGYALAPGRHRLRAERWLPSLAANAVKISYDVAARQTPSGPQPDVTFHVAWEER